MSKDEQDRHEIERIVRRAEALGHDPGRVAQALGHAVQPLPQSVAEAVPSRPPVARAGRLFARGSRAPGA